MPFTALQRRGLQPAWLEGGSCGWGISDSRWESLRSAQLRWGLRNRLDDGEMPKRRR
jgi:hypothetical protein